MTQWKIAYRRSWVRLLVGRGLPPPDIAYVLGIPVDLVEADLARHRGRRPRTPASPPRVYRRGNGVARRIAAQTGVKVRRLNELGYSPRRIADILLLELVTVQDFLVRLAPCHRDRAPELARPRGRTEQAALERSAARRFLELEERREKTPPGDWRRRDRSNAEEIAAYARALEAIRLGRATATEILTLTAGIYFAAPRSAIEAPPRPSSEPAIWTGSTELPRRPTKLDPDKIAEMKVLRSAGWSTGALAKRYGVQRATVCYALLGRTWQPPPCPAPLILPSEYPQNTGKSGV